MHVISGLGTGGAETMLVQLARNLKDKGFEQQVVSVSDRGAKAEELEAEAIPVHSLRLNAMLAAPYAIVRLARLIQAFRPDVLQGWMYHGDLFATFAHYIAPGRVSRKLFWNIRASNTDEGGYGGLLFVNSRLSRLPDVVLANSQAGLDFHLAKGYRPRRTEVIPNGVDVSRFLPSSAIRREVRSELSIPENASIAIHVARVDPMKDHATFVGALRQTPEVYGIMVGAGTELLEIPANVRALGLRRDVERLYAAADMVVSTSVYAEGFSNVLAEGMSAGLVPVSTDIGDARAIVGDTGYVIAPRDQAALSAAIATEVARPAAECRARGLAARTRIADSFGLERAIARYMQLYGIDQ